MAATKKRARKGRKRTKRSKPRSAVVRNLAASLKASGRKKLRLGTVVSTRSVPADMLPSGTTLVAAGRDLKGTRLYKVVRQETSPRAARESAVAHAPATAPMRVPEEDFAVTSPAIPTPVEAPPPPPVPPQSMRQRGAALEQRMQQFIGIRSR